MSDGLHDDKTLLTPHETLSFSLLAMLAKVMIFMLWNPYWNWPKKKCTMTVWHASPWCAGNEVAVENVAAITGKMKGENDWYEGKQWLVANQTSEELRYGIWSPKQFPLALQIISSSFPIEIAVSNLLAVPKLFSCWCKRNNYFFHLSYRFTYLQVH